MMSHIKCPVVWEIFNDPPIQPIEYYSLLKNKRHFSQYVEQYNSQVFKLHYLHYCGIVPKQSSSSLNYIYEIYIIFLDKTLQNSLTGFRIKVCKETFMHESNSLLLFLKKSKQAIFYSMSNNCIYVQCGENAWELFYHLYDDYLRNYVLTVIGTQFFYHFIYLFCIEREKDLLEMLYTGSKVIKVSKLSIYYKIHRKRKISVTDLIHMTVNMPKRKKYIVSYFYPQKSILKSVSVDRDFYTACGNKVKVSKLMLKKYKIQNLIANDAVENCSATNKKICTVSDSLFHANSLSIPFGCRLKSEKYIQETNPFSHSLKRKLNEIENHDLYVEAGSTSFKYHKTSRSCNNKNQWKQFQTLRFNNVKRYSNIPFIKPLAPNLLKNEKSYHFLMTYGNKSLTSRKKKGIKKDTSTIHDTHTLTPFIEPYKNCAMLQNLEMSRNESEVNMPSTESPKQPYFCEHNQDELYLFSNCSDSRKNFYDAKCSISSLSKCTEDINQDFYNVCEDVCFTTAAGTEINISHKALQKAQQLIVENFNIDKQSHESTSYLQDKSKLPDKNHPSMRKNIATDILKISREKFLHDVSAMKIEKKSKPFLPVLSTDIEKQKQNNLSASGDVDFLTAAGSTISVSNTAMQAAQKLIQDVSSDEKEITSTKSMYLSTQKNADFKNVLAFKDAGCFSKEYEEMDEVLVKNFFEDDFFDERELESTDANIKRDTSHVLESTSNKNLLTHKVRKSLGGRRSIRFFPDKS